MQFAVKHFQAVYIHLNLFYRFIYCEEANLTCENVTKCLNCAKKYKLIGLSGQCVELLKEIICPQNVCTIYNHAMCYSLCRLVQSCLFYIGQHVKHVLSGEDFLRLPKASAFHILDQNLPLEEKEIVLAVRQWAKDKSACEKQGTTLFLREKRLQLENLWTAM